MSLATPMADRGRQAESSRKLFNQRKPAVVDYSPKPRTLLLILAALGMSWALAGCAPKETANEPQQAAQSQDAAPAEAATPAPEAAAPAAVADLIARDKLFGNPARSSAQLSPDGKRIAYLAPRDGVMNVWVAPRTTSTRRSR